MREAVGGAFMIKLMMVFLVIYVIFIAMALNYAKAFKTKNGIIDYIEKYEGYNDYSKAAIDAYLDRIRYNVPAQGPNGSYASSNPNAVCFDRGYCIEEVDEDGRVKAKVVTFIQFSFFQIDDNYNFTGRLHFPPIVISGDIQKFSPYWTMDFD